jgi:DNA-binding NarL/FixJ family response regulator
MRRDLNASSSEEGDRGVISVVVADDHPIVRKGVIGELERHAGYRILGEAENGDEALQLSQTLNPDVLLLDINMPGMKAVDVIKMLREQGSPTQVLVLSAYGDSEYVVAALRAGAQGYMMKDEDPSTIIEGIRVVAEGKTWLSSTAAASLVNHSVRLSELEEAGLTTRERAILGLLAKGYSNALVAEELSIAEGTVKNHITRIYDKLGVHTRAEAVAWAWENGVVIA